MRKTKILEVFAFYFERCSGVDCLTCRDQDVWLLNLGAHAQASNVQGFIGTPSLTFVIWEKLTTQAWLWRVVNFWEGTRGRSMYIWVHRNHQMVSNFMNSRARPRRKAKSHPGAAFQFHPDLLLLLLLPLLPTAAGKDQLSGEIDFWSSLPGHRWLAFGWSAAVGEIGQHHHGSC